MNSLYVQRGMSYWSVMFGMMLAVVVIKAALITWPAYWDNKLINETVTQRLKETPATVTLDKFKGDISLQLDRNNIRDIKVDDIMKVTNEGGLKVQTDYEVRQNFIANIDLVVKFQRKFDQRAIKAGE
jgi:hypothetical protein